MRAALIWNFWFWSSLGVYSVASTGAGLLLLRVVGASSLIAARKSPFVFLATAFLLGLGSLGQLWTLVALSGQLTRIVTVPLLGLLTITHCCWTPAQIDLAVSLRNTLDELRRAPLGLRVVLVSHSLPLPILHFTGPRVFWRFPCAAYDGCESSGCVGIARTALVQAGNEPYGLIGEMTYAVLMQIGSDDAAQMVTWVVLFAIAATLVGYARRSESACAGKSSR